MYYIYLIGILNNQILGEKLKQVVIESVDLLLKDFESSPPHLKSKEIYSLFAAFFKVFLKGSKDPII